MISFIIVTYNSEDYIDACVQSIQKEMPDQNYEIIIVDNASPRRLPDVDSKFPNVTLIRNSLNRGYAVANNMGMQAATGDILWLLNPDTILVGGCVKHAMICFKDPVVGIIGNRLTNPDGSLQKSVFANVSLLNELVKALALPGLVMPVLNRFPRLKNRIEKLRGGHQDLSDLHGPAFVPMVIGASMIVKRTMIDEIGFFDARYFMYLEEADLCFRAHKYGWRVLYCPESTVIHYGGHATWNMAGSLYIEQFKSLILFFSLYYRPWHVLACRAVLLFAAMLRILLIPTPLYNRELGMGAYQTNQRTIKFSRYNAFISYLKLILLAFTPVPVKADSPS